MKNTLLTTNRQRTVYSDYLKRHVIINDDCGCTSGGFIEKEITEHGFRGSHVGKWVVIICENCKKELSQMIPKA